MREAQELSEATSQYHAQPLEDNLFEWHFTVRGPADTDFEGGIYHGRIVLPTEYPMKPPNIIVLTPNGRFETNKKICLSISGHHPESWQPSWSIRAALLAIIGFMPTEGHGTIGSLDYPSEERKALARRSVSFHCDECGGIAALLKSEDEEEADAAAARRKAEEEMKEIVKNVAFKGEERTSDEKESTGEKSDKVAPPDDGLSDEVRERKRLSLAAQQKFRKRLMQRQGKPEAKGANSQSSSGTAAARAAQGDQRTPGQRSAARQQQQQARAAARQQQREDDRSTIYDYLIVILLVAIAAIVYRRFALVADGDDPTTAPLT